MTGRETPEHFLHWLRASLDSPEARANMSWTELYGRLMNVEIGESVRVQAIRENEQFNAWVEAGFARAEALKLLLNDRAALISAAVAQQVHKQEREEGRDK